MPKLLYRTTLPKPDDPDILEGITNLVGIEGLPLRFAAPLLGISEHTAYHWVTEGERALEATPEGQELGSHALFGQTLKEARAMYVRARLGKVHAGEKDWAAHMTALERQYPADFGRYNRVEVESRSVSVQVLIDGPTAQALLEARSALGELPGGAPAQLPPGGAADSAPDAD